MNSVFADTFCFLALLNVKDAAHARACEDSESQDVLLVTTAWVLTEVANSLARSSKRQVFRRLVEDLEAAPENQVVPASQELFQRGLDLYDARPDKQWSLTDCISFVVMQEHGVRDALTGHAEHRPEGQRATLRALAPDEPYSTAKNLLTLDARAKK
jgi:uncharacterized protein